MFNKSKQNLTRHVSSIDTSLFPVSIHSEVLFLRQIEEYTFVIFEEWKVFRKDIIAMFDVVHKTSPPALKVAP